MQLSEATTINVKNYVITRLSRQNLGDLARLHSSIYSPVSEIDFERKYNTAYTGVEYIGFIAYSNDGRPIAYYGVIPTFLEFRNQKILAAQSADTMTHPGYRFKGMFMELSIRTFELCKSVGIKLLFGFPNQNSYKGAIKLGWKMTEMMDCFTIGVKSLPFESASKLHPGLTKMYKRYVNSILTKDAIPLNGITNSAITEGHAGVVKCEKYLQHKTYSESKVLKIRDAKVWMSTKNNLTIGDIDGVTQLNFKTVVNALKRIAFKTGKRQLQFQCSPGTQLHKMFSSICKPTASFPILFQDFGSPIPIEKIKFTFSDIDIF